MFVIVSYPGLLIGAGVASASARRVVAMIFCNPCAYFKNQSQYVECDEIMFNKTTRRTRTSESHAPSSSPRRSQTSAEHLAEELIRWSLHLSVASGSNTCWNSPGLPRNSSTVASGFSRPHTEETQWLRERVTHFYSLVQALLTFHHHIITLDLVFTAALHISIIEPYEYDAVGSRGPFDSNAMPFQYTWASKFVLHVQGGATIWPVQESGLAVQLFSFVGRKCPVNVPSE